MAQFQDSGKKKALDSSCQTGAALLHDPARNKGTAFTEAERIALGLRGLLPPHVASMDEQLKRIAENYYAKPTALDKFVNLTALHDRNETLFFKFLSQNLDETLPIIYTPTVGLACQKFGHIFERPRGIFLSIKDKGHMEEALNNWPEENIKIIVVTDGERILGLGDLGANGMGIPVGKLALYTAAAGIDPKTCLPVIIDVGTNNKELLDDPLYIGLRQNRITGAAYDELIDEFIQATQKVFPGVLVQFEDFANHNAFRLLHHYRNRICTFNDDIQGTAAVTVAGILSALRITKSRLRDQRILFMGAGEAATGIADLTVTIMMDEGQNEAEARKCCWLFDSQGLVTRGRTKLAEHKIPYAHDFETITDFTTAIEKLKPTAIIGVAAVGGTFTQTVIETMSRLNERPIIFALSNPTSKAECTAEQAYTWSKGKALYASGSPFNKVTYEGQTFIPGQGNNMYIFPGVGLGIIAACSNRVTNEMFMAAARTLAKQVNEEDLKTGSLYPPLSRIRELSAAIATATAETAYQQDYATYPRPADLNARVKSLMYQAEYESLV